MKNILFITILFFLLNCSTNKVSNTHGLRFLENKFEKIQLNKSNKNDLRKIIGPPSSVSKFDDIWIYIERKKINQSLFKLGKKRITKNNILILNFNNKGLVSDKQLLNLNNMNDIKIAEKTTKKKFGQDNFTYNLLSTLREKINAPTRRNQKRK